MSPSLTASSVSDRLTLKTNRARTIRRFTTLEALCRELGCQPGELLEFVSSQGAAAGGEGREI
jgi:putative transcriptional regulator